MLTSAVTVRCQVATLASRWQPISAAHDAHTQISVATTKFLPAF